MLADILFSLTRNRPMRLIEVGGGPYLERYHIASVFGRRIWLHHFVRDDKERHVHDHPWSAVSLVLCGGYTEELGEVIADRMVLRDRTLTAGQINVIKSTTRHRIKTVQPGTWTLMLVSKRHGSGWWFYEPEPDGTVTRSQPYGDTRPDWHRYAGDRATVYVERRAARYEKVLDRLIGRIDRVEQAVNETRIR